MKDAAQIKEAISRLESRLNEVDSVAVTAAQNASSIRVALGAFRRNVRTEIEALKLRLGQVERGRPV